MSKGKNTGLGRGLDAIFIDNSSDTAQGGITMLRLSDIEPRKDQPRKSFDDASLAQLAESITAHGLIQPIVVRQNGGFYQIIAGERRYRACKMAGLIEVPVIIVDSDEQKTDEIALIENIQREDLNSMEEARAIKALLDRHGLTQEALSKRIGKSRSAIANSIRLLELPPEAASYVAAGRLSAGHARALLAINDPDTIDKAAQMVLEQDLSVRQTEELAKKLNRPSPPTKERGDLVDYGVRDVDYAAELSVRMTSELGRRVKITDGKRVKKIEIEYADNSDLEKIIKKLCGASFLDIQ